MLPRPVPVLPEITGSVSDNYYAGDPVFEPDVVTISGAASDVNLATSASCPIDLTGLTEWSKRSMDVTILDEDNNALDTKLFSPSVPSVIVDMSILPVKTIPVDVDNSIMGQDSLAPGYEVTGIECDPATVQIVGAAESA